MTLRYDDEAGGAFDPDKHGEVIRAADPDYDEDILDEEPDPAEVPSGQVLPIEDLGERAGEVRERIEDRRRHGATEKSLAADLMLLDRLDYEIERVIAIEDPKSEPEADPAPVVSAAQSPWREALAGRLSPDDLALYDARRAGASQAELARRLGVRQGTISKREARIVATAQELHLKLFGRPLTFLDGKRRAGVRGKGRRNITPSE